MVLHGVSIMLRTTTSPSSTATAAVHNTAIRSSWNTLVVAYSSSSSPSQQSSSSSPVGTTGQPCVFYFFPTQEQPQTHAGRPQPQQSQRRTYVSRAHPKPRPVFPIQTALEDLLSDVRHREARREERWKNKQQTAADGESSPKPLSHPDETIELALNLNLDPRKPGQALRGSIRLPNGSGKKINCLVLSNDEAVHEAARQAGAVHAGGESLVDALVAGQIAVDSLDRSLATVDVMPAVSKKAARLLGPRGLMPNAKTGTLFTAPDDLLEALDTQIAGRDVLYRTEKAGVVHVRVGKASFGVDKLVENVGQIMKDIFAAKPESYGKGKKKGKTATGSGAKYLLQAYVSSTQGRGIKLDLRTVDPASPFFLTSEEAAKSGGGVPTTTAEESPEQRSSESKAQVEAVA